MPFACLAESYLRRCIKPLEALLTSHKRLVVKDSAVSNSLPFCMLSSFLLLIIPCMFISLTYGLAANNPIFKKNYCAAKTCLLFNSFF